MGEYTQQPQDTGHNVDNDENVYDPGDYFLNGWNPSWGLSEVSASRQEVEAESGTFNLAWDKAFEEFDRTIEDSTLHPPAPDEEKEEHPHSVEQAQVAMEEDKTTTPNTHAGISVCPN